MELRISFFINGDRDLHVTVTANCESWDEVLKLIEAAEQAYLKRKQHSTK